MCLVSWNFFIMIIFTLYSLLSGGIRQNCNKYLVMAWRVYSSTCITEQQCYPWPWSLALSCPRGQILALALKVKSLALALRVVLGLGLEQKSLALAKQVLGLAGLVICQTNNTATVLKSTFIA